MDYKTLFDAIMLGEADSLALASDIDSFVAMIKQALAEIDADGYAVDSEKHADAAEADIGRFMTPSDSIYQSNQDSALLLEHKIEKRETQPKSYIVPRVI